MFSKPELTRNLINALLRGATIPDPKLSTELKRRRFSRATKALLTRNLFLPIRVLPGTQSFLDVSTGYSPPIETDILAWAWTWANEDTVATNLGTNRQIQLSIDGRPIISDVPASPLALGHNQFNTFGPLRLGFGACAFPCPVRIPKGSRVVAQLSWNPSPLTGSSAQIPTVADTILLWCLSVKTCLDDDDQELLERIRDWIDGHEYQEPVLLNSVTPDGSVVPRPYTFAWPAYGVVGPIGSRMFTQSQTRTISAPMLVRAMATNLTFSELQIRDSRGHNFTPTGWVNARNMGAIDNSTTSNVYWKLAVPHVLAPGALLTCDHLTAYSRHTINPAGPGEFSNVNWKLFSWNAVTV